MKKHLIVGFVVLFSVVGCGSALVPKIVESSSEHHDFSVVYGPEKDTGSPRCITSIEYWSPRQSQFLWWIYIAAAYSDCLGIKQELANLNYGDVPPNMEQLFPHSGSPRAPIESEVVVVRLHYQYDDLVPTVSQKLWAFQKVKERYKAIPLNRKDAESPIRTQEYNQLHEKAFQRRVELFKRQINGQ